MLIFAFIFLTLFAVAALGIGLGRAFLISRQKQQIRNMLKRAESAVSKRGKGLVKVEVAEDSLSKALAEHAAFQKLAGLLKQSGMDWELGKFVVLTGSLAVLGTLIGFLLPPFSRTFVTALIPGALGALLPMLVVLRKRAKRLAKFEEQFPEALNFLGRAMRAGHAYSIGLEMLVADSPEPLAGVFREMLHDLHLGATLESAMAKLANSVPLIDVRFFVSAVLLQQGTGGNLAEILDNMSSIIRERFQLRGKVKAAAAHGKITGSILAIMPIIIGCLMLLISPSYLLVLVTDPAGRKMAFGAVAAQIVAFFTIRKIVNIKV